MINVTLQARLIGAHSLTGAIMAANDGVLPPACEQVVVSIEGDDGTLPMQRAVEIAMLLAADAAWLKAQGVNLKFNHPFYPNL